MLGLGNSLTQNSVLREITAPYSYSQDVIQAGDGWEALSVSGSPTIQYNQTAPDSTAGWMKLTFDETQANFWALQNTDILNGRVEVGSTATISYEIFLDTAALWGDGSGSPADSILWQNFYGSKTSSSTAVTAGNSSSTTISKSISATSTASIIQLRQFLYTAEDLPLAGAEVYIKNLSISITYT
jgi:hypothetical protein